MAVHVPTAVLVAVAVATLALAATRHTTPARVTADARDRRQAARYFGVVPVRGKGRGVVALRDVPAWTCLGPYPGAVRTLQAHERLKARGRASDAYAVQFWDSRPGGRIDDTLVIDPAVGGRLAAPYRHAAAAYVNEPAGRQRPNAAWTWNFPRHRVELWTTRPLKRGEEVCAWYGDAYDRGYAVPAAAESPPRLAVGYRHPLPRPWHAVVNMDDTAPGPAGA